MKAIPVMSARKLFNKLGAAVTEIDISTKAYLTIQSVFEDADVIYFTGGNSFFLMERLRKTGTDELLKKELAKGKLMIGESAGAIICCLTRIRLHLSSRHKPRPLSRPWSVRT